MSFNKEKLEQKFAEEYDKLNEKQRLAVDTIEGPVMVIAGPGTGKTQILASRIGKILWRSYHRRAESKSWTGATRGRSSDCCRSHKVGCSLCLGS
jgi:hypothetical protein